MPNGESKELWRARKPVGLMQPLLKTGSLGHERALELQKRLACEGIQCRLTKSNQAVISLKTGENALPITDLMREYQAKVQLQLCELHWDNCASVICSGIGGPMDAFYTTEVVEQLAAEQVFARFALDQRHDQRPICLIILATATGGVGIFEIRMNFDAQANILSIGHELVKDRTAILARAIGHAKNRARNPRDLWPWCSNTRESRPTWPRRLISRDVDERLMPPRGLNLDEQGAGDDVESVRKRLDDLGW